jgi:hypothetical protein
MFRMPSLRKMAAMGTGTDVERQTVEKGRETPGGGEAATESVYKGRSSEDGETPTPDTDRSRRETELPTPSGVTKRATRTYETGGANADTGTVPRDMSRSRRKVTDMRRWA